MSTDIGSTEDAAVPMSARARAALASGYTIRVAQIADAARLASVHAQVWRETYTGLMPPEVLDGLDARAGEERWEQILTADPKTRPQTLVGVDPGGRIVALGSAGRARDEDAPVGLELWAINVLASDHGTGLGDLLLAHLVGEAPAYLWVVDGNARAIAFYTRHGFVVDDGRPDARFGVRELRMSRGSHEWRDTH